MLNSDCALQNLMMDSSELYPEGFHPVHKSSAPNGLDRAWRIPRAFAHTKYYYVDFGIAVHIPPDVYPKRASGRAGLDREVPELEQAEYDPFKVDIFILGNLFRKEFCAVHMIFVSLDQF